MKFLCDEMLQRFGRWLRAAGYDTEIISDGRNDFDVIKLARKERRLLLSCDRALTHYRGAEKTVVLLESGSLDDYAEQLNHKYKINWLLNPFSRCLTCNTPLKHANANQRETIPEKLKHDNDEADVRYCSSCNKVYWQGDHVQHMQEQLEKWHKIFH